MLATCVFSTLQHLLVGCEMEARRCVELTEGSRAVATITQMNPAYYEASGPPSWPLVSWARHAALQPLQSTSQSPPPSDLSPHSGSGGRSSETEWSGGARAMRASGHPAEGLRHMAGASVAPLWTTSGEREEEAGAETWIVRSQLRRPAGWKRRSRLRRLWVQRGVHIDDGFMFFFVMQASDGA
jgi:hypothetical protein